MVIRDEAGKSYAGWVSFARESTQTRIAGVISTKKGDFFLRVYQTG